MTSVDRTLLPGFCWSVDENSARWVELNYWLVGICCVGGTWGDHIDLIISKDYACGKGSAQGPGICGGPQQQSGPPGSGSGSGGAPVARSPVQQGGVQQPKSENDMAPYISWKLRRALQHEKEQQEQQQQMHQNHPDERNIIRVVQHSESQHSSRPPSVPSSKDVNYPP